MNRISTLGAVALATVGLVAGCSGNAGKDGVNGLDGKVTLVRIDTEPTGTNCENGGTAIKVGVDANSDGKLDDAEVNGAQTRYVCNGGKGNPGNNGPKALVKTVAEPRGTNCEYGGFRIDSGLDDNGNGTLEAGEVDSSQYICEATSLDTIYFGTLYVDSAEKLEQLSGIEVVVGNLYIDAALFTELSLPNLKVVVGQLSISYKEEQPAQEGLTSIELPALVRVSDYFGITAYALETLSVPVLEQVGYFEMYNTDLTELMFPALVTVQETSIEENALLVAANFPALVQVYGELELQYNPELTTINVPELKIASSIDIDGNKLAVVSAPKLESLGEFSMENQETLVEFSAPKLKRFYGLHFWSPVLTKLDLSSLEEAQYFELNDTALTKLSLPALKTIGDEFYVYDNPQLTAIELPALEFLDDAEIRDNEELTTLNMSALTDANGWIWDNAKLSECAITAVNSGIVSRGGSLGLWSDGGNLEEECSNEVYCPFITVNGVSDRYRYCWDMAQKFDEARTTCEGFGGDSDLVTFDDAAEFQSVQALTESGILRTNVWIGYTDAAVEGTWAWVNGATGYVPGATDTFWGENEGTGGTTQNCAAIGSNGPVYDEDCVANVPFVCKIVPAAP